MCKRPIFLPNPYYHTPNLSDHCLTDKELCKKYGHRAIYKGYSFLHDTIHQRIAVPCGDCAECYALKQSYLSERLQLGSLVYDYWLITLTYNSRNLPIVHIGNYRHPFADYTHIQNMFKRIRQKELLPNEFRYFVASEYGGQFHRPHFHVVLALPKRSWQINEREAYTKYLFDLFLSEWKINKSNSDKFPIWDSLLDYKVNKRTGKATYDCRAVSDFVDKAGKLHLGAMEVGFYLTKYVTKFDKWLNAKKHMLRINYPEFYKYYWNLLKPRWRFSKGFLYSSYNVKDVKNSTLWQPIVDKMMQFHSYNLQDPDKGFRFYIPEKQKSVPLDPYLRDKFYSANEIFDIFYLRTSDRYSDIDNSLIALDADEARKLVHDDNQKDFHLQKVRKLLHVRNLSGDFSDYDYPNCSDYDIDIEPVKDYDEILHPFTFEDIPKEFLTENIVDTLLKLPLNFED